jgi:hypothetical protein
MSTIVHTYAPDCSIANVRIRTEFRLAIRNKGSRRQVFFDGRLSPRPSRRLSGPVSATLRGAFAPDILSVAERLRRQWGFA